MDFLLFFLFFFFSLLHEPYCWLVIFFLSIFLYSTIFCFVVCHSAAMLVFFFQIKQIPFELNPYQQNKTHRNKMPNPKKENPFEFNPHPQNTNQTKHLEQHKRNKLQKRSKVLGPRAERDEVHEEKEKWVFVKRKERDNETLIREISVSSIKILLNALFMSYNYPYFKKIHTHTKHTIMFFTFLNMFFENHYQTHFLHYEYFKHVFLQHFLNHGFHIILNNNT